MAHLAPWSRNGGHCDFLVREISMNLVLLAFRVKWFATVQLLIASISFWKLQKSESDLIGLKSKMSSANTKSFVPGDRETSEMSLIYSRKSNRPSIDPCGTPDLTGSRRTSFEDRFLISAHQVVNQPAKDDCRDFEMVDFIQECIVRHTSVEKHTGFLLSSSSVIPRPHPLTRKTVWWTKLNFLG